MRERLLRGEKLIPLNVHTFSYIFFSLWYIHTVQVNWSLTHWQPSQDMILNPASCSLQMFVEAATC